MNPADQLIARVFGLQVDILHAHARIEAASDSEALHDLRIALRRLRSLLRPLREAEELVGLDQAAAELLRQSSALRDAEVLADELQRRGWQAEAGRRRQRQLADCRRLLRGRAASRLQAEFERWPAALRQVADEVDLARLEKRIGKLMKRRLKRLREVLGQTDADLHAIRLQVKGVRYLRDGYAEWAPLAPQLADDLKRLQSLLGDVHDLDLWCARAAREPLLRPLLETWSQAKEQTLLEARAEVARLAAELGAHAGGRHRVPALVRVS